MRKSIGIAAAAFGVIAGSVSAQDVLEFRDDNLRLSNTEKNWLDTSFSKAERALLSSTRGYAPPPITDELEWKNTTPRTWEDLKGQVIVLQSWTHATPSTFGLPMKLHRRLENYDSEKIEVVALHTPEDADAERLDRFVQRFPDDLAVLVDQKGNFCDELGIFKKPVTTIIDQRGTIRYAGVSDANVIDAVEHLLEQDPDPAEESPPALTPRDERSIELMPGPKHKIKRRGFIEFLEEVEEAEDLMGKRGPKINTTGWATEQPSFEGRITVLVLWSQEDLPFRRIKYLFEDLTKLHTKYNENVVILVLAKEHHSRIQNFLVAHPYPFAFASDDSEDPPTFEAVEPDFLPYTLVMDPAGIVRWQGHPSGITDNIMDSILQGSGLRVPEAPPINEGPRNVDLLPRWVPPKG